MSNFNVGDLVRYRPGHITRTLRLLSLGWMENLIFRVEGLEPWGCSAAVVNPEAVVLWNDRAYWNLGFNEIEKVELTRSGKVKLNVGE